MIKNAKETLDEQIQTQGLSPAIVDEHLDNIVKREAAEEK